MKIDFTIALYNLKRALDGIISALPNVFFALLTVLAFYILGKLISISVRKMTFRRGHAYAAGMAIGRIIQGIIIILGILVATSIALPGFKPRDVIEFLGIGSIAAGFAFRDILQNFLAGIFILFARSFNIGDQIVIGASEGTIEEIQTRATFIRTYDNRRVVIPNSMFFTERVVVNTAFPSRRVEYDLGIGMGDEIGKAKKLILESLREQEIVLREPLPDILVMEIAPYSVILRVRWWVKPPRHADALDSRDAVLGAIKTKLMKNGIDIPFPTQQVLFHDQTEEDDGNRLKQREGWPAGDNPPGEKTMAGAILKLGGLFLKKQDEKTPPGKHEEIHR